MALKRENANRITHRVGSIMNTSMLGTLAGAVHDAVDRYGASFKKVIVKDTNDGNVRSVNVELLNQILDRFESFVNPEILIVPKQAMEDLRFIKHSIFIPSAEMERIQMTIETKGQYRRRTEVESDTNFVQIVPCGVLLYEGRIFLFQRQDQNPKSRLYGKSTIWQGCHVVSPADGQRSQSAVLAALETRMAQSLFISRKIKSRFVGYTWDKSDQARMQHFGIIFRLDIESSELAESLKKKEFRRSRGHSLAGDFKDVGQLISGVDNFDLEPWSRAILQDCQEILQ